MRKIPCVFLRDFGTGDRRVRPEVTPGCEWVLSGEGAATLKYDGTCCMARGGRFYRRYDAKHGKVPPAGFEPAQEADPVTGHWPGWIPVKAERPADRWHCQALGDFPDEPPPDGTYELIGPKINGNPYTLHRHMLVTHGTEVVSVGRSYAEIHEWLASNSAVEGLVFHHTDGRMAKIRRRDFGLAWPPAESVCT